MLIESLAPLAGAHFNPPVSLALAFRGDVTGRAAVAYVPAQIAGAVIGVGIANAMFDVPLSHGGDRRRGGCDRPVAMALARRDRGHAGSAED